MLGRALGAAMPVWLRVAAPAGAAIASAPGVASVPGVTSTEAAPSLEAAIRAFTGGAPVRAGKVRVQIAPLVDNGNTVPLSVTVDHPMRPNDHVAAIAVFSERNPQHEVANFGLGPRNPAAKVSTRIRLATSQKLVAIARLSDGSHWSGEVDVIVTLAACIED
jgi:sulfur-oxidizing protein SoxY